MFFQALESIWMPRNFLEIGMKTSLASERAGGIAQCHLVFLNRIASSVGVKCIRSFKPKVIPKKLEISTGIWEN